VDDVVTLLIRIVTARVRLAKVVTRSNYHIWLRLRRLLWLLSCIKSLPRRHNDVDPTRFSIVDARSRTIIVHDPRRPVFVTSRTRRVRAVLLVTFVANFRRIDVNLRRTLFTKRHLVTV
jgi:hypothetical protein